MPELQRAGVEIHYEVEGPESGIPLVLVAGLGEQIGSVEYPDDQVAIFIERGFRVIRLDNRDMGRSRVEGVREVDIVALLKGLGEGAPVPEPPYTLLDMADDVAAVIEDLGIPRANLMGASMGGFIVRWAALRHPERVASITVVMSGSAALPGDDGPGLESAVVERLVGLTEPRNRSDAIEFGTQMWRWLWGAGYPFEEDWVRERVSYAFDRAYRPEAVSRLMAAVVQTPGLWEAQTKIQCPTLVIHGGEDPCFSGEHGESIAARIPGAKLWLDPRMGHVLHREQWKEMAERAAELSPL